MWEKLGLVAKGKSIEHTSMWGSELSDNKNAEAMMKMFVNLPAEVITQDILRIHEVFSKFCHIDYFKESLDEKDIPLAGLHVIQGCFIIIQNRCVKATEALSRLVTSLVSKRLRLPNNDLQH